MTEDLIVVLNNGGRIVLDCDEVREGIYPDCISFTKNAPSMDDYKIITFNIDAIAFWVWRRDKDMVKSSPFHSIDGVWRD